MALNLRCDRCWREIDEPAALVFSPPRQGQCVKKHICGQCWHALWEWIECKVDRPSSEVT